MNKKKIINDFLMHLRSYNKWNITKESNKSRFKDLKDHGIQIKKLTAEQKLTLSIKNTDTNILMTHISLHIQ